jgi:hypothetical protein
MPEDRERVATWLDSLGRRWMDTNHRKLLVVEMAELTEGVDWAEEILAAAERQEAANPEANTLRVLFDMLAPQLLEARLR